MSKKKRWLRLRTTFERNTVSDMAKEYNPGKPNVVEFTIKKTRVGRDRAFRVTCGPDGWTDLADSESAAALLFDSHRRRAHPHSQVKRVL